MDWEFYENGRTIDPISVGLVAADGRELYLINEDMNWRDLYDYMFLREHVAPHLPVKPYAEGGPWDLDHPDIDHVLSPSEMAAEVSEFFHETPDPEIWADHAAYDHVCLAQLFGRMIDMPKHIPWQTDDVRTEWKRLGKPELPKQLEAEKHHALKDAHHDKVIMDYLNDLELMREIGQKGVYL
jgi:hypothetical protein